jgi:hypothetical protein
LFWGTQLLGSGEGGQGAEDVFGFGADAEVGVGFGVEDFALGGEDVGCREWEPPALVTVDEGYVEEDAAVVAAEVVRGGPDEAVLLGDGAAGIGEEREGDGVLAGRKVVLALSLRGDADDQGAAFAEGGVEVAPGFELGDAVGAPAAAEEIDDEGAEGEHVGGADDFPREVGQGKRGRGCAGGEDTVFDAGAEKLVDRALADGEALGLDQGAGLGGDFVELVLQVSHGNFSVIAGARYGLRRNGAQGLRW